MDEELKEYLDEEFLRIENTVFVVTGISTIILGVLIILLSQ